MHLLAASNKLKEHIFDSKHVMKQLRYAGVMDVVRVRQSGFALRRDLANFLMRYRFFVPSSVGDAHGAVGRGDLAEQRRLC
eukprot:SAG31_NODE_14534_length_801_cov_0.727920_2_plen_80_part_01